MKDKTENTVNLEEELYKVANLLQSVSVPGQYWITMQACVNSVTNVANALREGRKDEVNNKRDA